MGVVNVKNLGDVELNLVQYRVIDEGNPLTIDLTIDLVIDLTINLFKDCT